MRLPESFSLRFCEKLYFKRHLRKKAFAALTRGEKIKDMKVNDMSSLACIKRVRPL